MRNPIKEVERYGAMFPASDDDLTVEMKSIQWGGTWADGKCGAGLFHHYRAMQQILWPDLDHHRWSDLFLKTILDHKVSCVLGAASTGKTHCAARYALCDYFCFPKETTIIVSSTDLRGLELRVWGELKSLLTRAQERFPELPGVALESKHSITTEAEDTDAPRDLRNGVICIPCLSSGGTWTGLGRYSGCKNKRVRMIGDECFVAGTPVNTINGDIPIEFVKPGDVVLSAAGFRVVLGTRSSIANRLVSISMRDGRKIKCTPEHRFFTQKGWVKALDLNQSYYIHSGYETMRILRETSPCGNEAVLQSILLDEMEDSTTGFQKEILYSRTISEIKHRTQSCSCSQTGVGKTDCAHHGKFAIAATYRDGEKNFSNAQENWTQAKDSRRERYGSNRYGKTLTQDVSWNEMELSGQNWNAGRKRIPNVLQSGCGFSRHSTCHRSGWEQSQSFCPKTERPKEDTTPNGTWVDSVEVQKQDDLGTDGNGAEANRVYNLHVEGHPSYCANGLVCHNCQFMKDGFLQSVSNLDKNRDFKAVFLGNPIDPFDQLGIAAEPKDGGWDKHVEPTKTVTWATKFYNGIALNLVGTDSPNFDYPADQPTRYPYLISREAMRNTEEFYGKDSLQYYSQCIGVMKTGIVGRRVISLEMCRQFQAFEEPIWGTEIQRTKVYAVDAAYGFIGGDRCVGGWIEFGKDKDGKIIVAMHPPVIIPVSIRLGIPEDQIAKFVMEDCERNNIPPHHVFFDATGRGQLGHQFCPHLVAVCKSNRIWRGSQPKASL